MRSLTIIAAIAFLAAQLNGASKFPCDVVACAEAYSVTRAMKTSYTGPLFQLYNGSSNLDIGQTANGTVDMTTWSAFCSGVAANCVYAKIYSQVNPTNNLVPSTLNTTFDCRGGSYVCATPFSIETATGLPVFISALDQMYYVGEIGGPEVAATGITAGTGPISIVYNGQSRQQLYCCGPFGVGHTTGQPDTPGTAFYVLLAYGHGGAPNSCSTNATFCAGIDEEEVGDSVDYNGSSPENVILGISFDPNANAVSATLNQNLLLTNSPPAGDPMNPGQYVHLGMGADFSPNAQAYMREVLITNSTLTSVPLTKLYTNMTTFYNTLSFP